MNFAIAQDASAQKYLCFDNVFRQGNGFHFGHRGEMEQPEIFSDLEYAKTMLSDYRGHFWQSAACVVEVEILGDANAPRFLKFKKHIK